MTTFIDVYDPNIQKWTNIRKNPMIEWFYIIAHVIVKRVFALRFWGLKFIFILCKNYYVKYYEKGIGNEEKKDKSPDKW